MSDEKYANVKVTVDGGRVVCDPDRVLCYWQTGPDNVRWIMPNPPPEAVSMVIHFKNETPFQRVGSEPSAASSRVRDVITAGNRQQRGIFPYAVQVLDASGKVVAEVDPEVENRPTPP